MPSGPLKKTFSLNSSVTRFIALPDQALRFCALFSRVYVSLWTPSTSDNPTLWSACPHGMRGVNARMNYDSSADTLL
jgi:hypothetical protein